MKIAIIGSNGLLGSALKKLLNKENMEYIPFTHDDLEIANEKDFDKITKNNINIIINTAAFLGVEPCEANPSKAFEINTNAVANLARFCNNNDITLVQISTDAVFDGKDGNYDEDSYPNPINMYGLTKHGGELMTKNLCSRYYIFRIPILFGKRENKGAIFIEKMYNLYKNGNKNLKIADDIINRPSYSNDIANGIINILKLKKEYGIYHLYNDGKASLYEFAYEFFKQKGIKDIKIERAKAADFARNELGKKPLNTCMISNKIKPLRDWKEAMNEYIKMEFKNG